MRGVFLTNKYYTDDGLNYAFESLKRAFGARASLEKRSPILFYDKQIYSDLCFDFAVLWDKDFYTAAAAAKAGIRVFNSAEVLAACDDKQKTYAAVTGIDIPKTISAPLMYDVNSQLDTEFLDFVASSLKFPVIVKQNTGSQGRQVFKAENMEQLTQLYLKLRHIPHHYQSLTGVFGEDLRVYTVGGKAIAACRRFGIDFKSNLGAGGRMELVDLAPEYKKAAETVSRQLNMDYGSVDFLIADKPILLEVNSNAYFKGIESLGADIATPLADYILTETARFKASNKDAEDKSMRDNDAKRTDAGDRDAGH